MYSDRSQWRNGEYRSPLQSQVLGPMPDLTKDGQITALGPPESCPPSHTPRFEGVRYASGRSSQWLSGIVSRFHTTGPGLKSRAGLNYGRQRHSEVHSEIKKNIIDADSGYENKKNNAASVPASSEMRNIRKTSYCLSYRSLGLYWRKTLAMDFHNLLLMPISYHSGSFAMREKGGKRLVPGPDYMVDALKLSNQAPRASGELLQTCTAWRCPDGTQHLFC
ncbi:hypothetical protein TNCV_2038151 [Trichonephila clavipes]|nr:hypothetical protein TNCV_2038151 [Trichonephila clavipes]